MQFIGYTYNRDLENQRSNLIKALLDTEMLKPTTNKTG
jgi:hypothetical protein